MKKIKVFSAIAGLFDRLNRWFTEPDNEAHIRVGDEWMPVKEYREKYKKDKNHELTPAEREALVCPSCGIASAYNCAKCMGIKNPVTQEELEAQGGNR